MNRPLISRRHLLLSSLAAAGCTTPKAKRFQGFCFVANRDGRSIAVVDLTRFRTRQRMALDAAPSQIVARPKTTKAYVLTPASGTVHELEAGLLQFTRRARAGNEAIAMRLSRTGDALWVLYRDPASLVEIPLDTMRPGRHIRLASVPLDFDLSREADEACIVSAAAKTISVVSLARASIDRTIQAAAEPCLARFRGDGRQLIAGSQTDRSLTFYDTPTGKTIVRLPLSIAPREFCFTGDGNLYVTGDGMDAVVSVFPYRTEVWETLLAGHAPGAMAATDTDRPPSYLLVTNPGADTVTVLDVETGKFVAVVQVGSQPRQIVITPDNEYALVLNEKSGDLAVIRIFSLGGNQVGGDRVKRYKSAPLFTMIPVGEGPVSAAVVALV
ncbi:MAG: beta-propeller fold lactonase family protein [Candidatus Solibacter sp.]